MWKAYLWPTRGNTETAEVWDKRNKKSLLLGGGLTNQFLQSKNEIRKRTETRRHMDFDNAIIGIGELQRLTRVVCGGLLG